MDHGLGRFCWTDLAASDAEAAVSFYQRMFGWASSGQPANGGRFTRLRIGAEEVASLCQLRCAQPETLLGYPQAPTHPHALQKSQPSLRITVKLPHSVQRAPFITAGSSSSRGASSTPISRVG